MILCALALGAPTVLDVPEALAREGLPVDVDLPHRHPIYVRPPTDGYTAELLQSVDVRWRSLDGEPVPAVPEARPALGSLLRYAAKHPGLLLEQEVRVGERVLQLLWRADVGVLLVRVGAVDAAVAPAPEDLWERLGGTAEGPWTQAGREAVWTALGELEEPWRSELSGIHWVQQEGRQGGAWLAWRKRAPVMKLTARAGCMEGTTYGAALIGPPQSARHLGVETAAHEVGHVIEGAAWARAVRENGRRRCARRAWKQMLQVYREQLGADSPSDYGAEGSLYLGEGFSEAWAFYVLHPDYLQRAFPQAFAWFQAHGPLTALDASYEACMER